MESMGFNRITLKSTAVLLTPHLVVWPMAACRTTCGYKQLPLTKVSDWKLSHCWRVCGCRFLGRGCLASWGCDLWEPLLVQGLNLYFEECILIKTCLAQKTSLRLTGSSMSLREIAGQAPRHFNVLLLFTISISCQAPQRPVWIWG